MTAEVKTPRKEQQPTCIVPCTVPRSHARSPSPQITSSAFRPTCHVGIVMHNFLAPVKYTQLCHVNKAQRYVSKMNYRVGGRSKDRDLIWVKEELTGARFHTSYLPSVLSPRVIRSTPVSMKREQL